MNVHFKPVGPWPGEQARQRAMTRVVVSKGDARRDQHVFECFVTPHGFICRACGFGLLGHKPTVGACCPECAARVEEVIEDRRRT